MSDGAALSGVPNDQRDEESGKFASKYTDEDFLDAIRALGGTAGTSDIAGEVGCPRRTAYHRLKQLREDGEVTSREIGNSLAWMLADE